MHYTRNSTKFRINSRTHKVYLFCIVYCLRINIIKLIRNIYRHTLWIMGLDSFTIVVINGPVFYPGNEISGSVMLDISGKSVKITDVEIKLKGVVRVMWVEYENDDPKAQKFKLAKQVFIQSQSLFGFFPDTLCDSGYNYKVIGSGHTEIPFVFQLPEGVSTSFEGKYGRIRYWLEAKIVTPRYSCNKTVNYSFTVMGQSVSSQNLMAPQERANEKNICCLCCKSGSIMMYVKINRQWFRPGESAVLEAYVENGSGRKLTLTASLYQMQLYVDNGGGQKTVKAVMSKSTTLGNISEHNTVTQTCYFVIPKVPPTIRDCLYIDVEYILKISLNIRGSLDLSVEFPIVVGTSNQYQQNHSPPSTTITWNNPALPTDEENVVNVTSPKLDLDEDTQSDLNASVPSFTSLPYERVFSDFKKQTHIFGLL